MRMDYDPTVEGWKTLLSASQSFTCHRLRSQAIEALERSRGSSEDLSAIDQVQLALKYDIESWLRPAYLQIVRREEMLSRDEAIQLPNVIALLLERSREVYHCHRNRRDEKAVNGEVYRTTMPVRTAEEIFEEQLAALQIDVTGKILPGKSPVDDPRRSTITDLDPNLHRNCSMIEATGLRKTVSDCSAKDGII